VPRRRRIFVGISALFLVSIALFWAVGYEMFAGSQFAGTQRSYVFGVIGNDTSHLTEEREAGIEAKLFYLSWREFYPQEGVKDTAYIAAKKEELQELREAGFRIILCLGYQDNPLWVHQNYSDSYYIDQYGERYTATGLFENGEANLVFNQQLRALVGSYMQDVISEFGTDFYAVRLGGGRYGELTYPPTDWHGKTNRYWAYDKNARTSSPVPSWTPGNPSPNGEASMFLDWYLNSLVDYQNWQISALRATGYEGKIMMLYPSWGIRPGQIDEALKTNLNGTTSAEKNGEIQRGYDFARQVKAISDPKVILTTTWLEANFDAAADDRHDARYWSPVHYLASLAEAHPLSLKVYGENGGQDDREAMALSASRMRRYGLIGMCWYNEEELFSGQFASLDDYERIIQTSENRYE
jgi:hypothetical protein